MLMSFWICAAFTSAISNSFFAPKSVGNGIVWDNWKALSNLILLYCPSCVLKSNLGSSFAVFLSDLEAEVKALLATKQKTFVSKPTEVKKPLTAQLAEEAMAFMTFQENSGKVDKINSFLQQFEVISEFEEFGLFFESDIVKLNKIYTMKEIVDAVTETIDLLK